MGASDSEGCHKYDITSKLSPYLDPKMLLYVMDWLSSTNIYPTDKLNLVRSGIKAKLDSFKLPDEEFTKMEEDYLNKIEKFKEALVLYKKDQMHRISVTFEKTMVPALLHWVKNTPEKLVHDLPDNVHELILKLAKAYYDRDDYENCKTLLLYYLNWVSKYTYEGSDANTKMKCYMGLICCNMLDVLLPSTEDELAEMSAMPIVQQDPDNDKDASLIDQRTPRSGVYCILKLAELLNGEEMVRDRKDLILKRSWLLHWSLFYVFKYNLALMHHSNKGSKAFEWPQLQEYFLDDRNLAVVNLVAPHLLRYYAVYAILNRNRKDHFKTISNVIATTKAKYSDTFTSLLGALFVDFNFEVAQKHIVEMKEACRVDVLLHSLESSIEESSRHIIFETYCRIHKSIKIETIAQNVNMPLIEAEKWIVNVIRHSHVDAKIDSEKNCVEISTVPPNLYQQVIEKTQNLTLRSHMILHNLNQQNPNVDNTLINVRTLEGADRTQTRRLFPSNLMRKPLQRFNYNREREYNRQDQETVW